MMEIQLKFILITCMVSFVFMSDQPNSQAINQFSNLFDSISKNDARKSEIYRENLKQVMARDQQAFNNMKDELLITRNKNVKKVVNFLGKMNTKENALVVKRNANENNVGVMKKVVNFFKKMKPNGDARKNNFDDPEKVDESFVEKYGGYEWSSIGTYIQLLDFVSSGIWESLVDIYNDTERLKRICTEAHEKTHREPTGEVKIYRCDQKNTIFSNPKYKPIDMEVIVYGIEGFNNKADGKPHYFYVGKGMAPDCLFYLNATDVQETTFRLADHVCGVEI